MCFVNRDGSNFNVKPSKLCMVKSRLVMAHKKRVASLLLTGKPDLAFRGGMAAMGGLKITESEPLSKAQVIANTFSGFFYARVWSVNRARSPGISTRTGIARRGGATMAGESRCISRDQ
ncbi:hypothetical protein Bbelb_330630 [Branchiostoma belcheri]|nr:hypothetical protein Bbelb_330630 [Branchiostoma belcheri]